MKIFEKIYNERMKRLPKTGPKKLFIESNSTRGKLGHPV